MTKVFVSTDFLCVVPAWKAAFPLYVAAAPTFHRPAVQSLTWANTH